MNKLVNRDYQICCGINIYIMGRRGGSFVKYQHDEGKPWEFLSVFKVWTTENGGM